MLYGSKNRVSKDVAPAPARVLAPSPTPSDMVTFISDCREAAKRSDPDAPGWYINTFCACSKAEVLAGTPIDRVPSICKMKVRAALQAKTKYCVATTGAQDKTDPLLRACVDKD